MLLEALEQIVHLHAVVMMTAVNGARMLACLRVRLEMHTALAHVRMNLLLLLALVAVCVTIMLYAQRTLVRPIRHGARIPALVDDDQMLPVEKYEASPLAQ